jgi:hypothetical protein
MRCGALSRRVSAAAPWTPANLSGLAPSLSVAMQRSSGLLWQNTAKTIPAVADTDPVRVATCPWTGVDYTAPSDAARPLLWDLGSGKWGLKGDGVDDILATTVLAVTTGYTVSLGIASVQSGNNFVFNNGSEANGFGYWIQGGVRNVNYNGVATLTGGSLSAVKEIVTFGRTGSTTNLFVDNVSQSLSLSTATPLTPTTSMTVFARTNGSLPSGQILTSAIIASAYASVSDRASLVTYQQGLQ